MEEVTKKTKSEKSRPLEFSCRSAVAVPKPRLGKVSRPVIPVDPRFNEEIAGEFDRSKFSKSYGFLDEYRDIEKKEIQTKLASKKTSCEDKLRLEKALTRMASQDVSRTKTGIEEEVRQELKVKELEAVAKTGKKAYYAPKSVIRKIVRERADELLGKSGGLKKYKAKQEQRILAKERSFMPKIRRVIDPVFQSK